LRLVALALIACALSGCASATRGWQEQLTVTSTPAGAQAEIISAQAGQPQSAPAADERSGAVAPAPVGPQAPVVCTTPCVVQIKRNDDITVRVSMPGYETAVVPLTKELAQGGAVGFAGNVLLGGVVGMAVDAASGATLDHKPNPVIVTLQPLPPPKPARPPARRQRSAPAAGM
jgi:hypothetical protein